MCADWSHTALLRVCGACGLDPTDATLLRFTNNAVYDLPHEAMVVRIAGSATTAARYETVVAAARWLQRHDFPAVRLSEHPQPLRTHGFTATIWHRCDSDGPPVTGTDLGVLLRRFHELPSPEPPLPAWDLPAKISERLSEQHILTDAEYRYLTGELATLTSQLNALDYVLPPGPIHGDAHTGNLIPTRQGPQLCDFDSSSTGPREWDLTPTIVGHTRLGRPDDHTPLVRAYGASLAGWPGRTVLVRLRELQLVTSALPILHKRPQHLAQWRHRFLTYRDADTGQTWQRYT